MIKWSRQLLFLIGFMIHTLVALNIIYFTKDSYQLKSMIEPTYWCFFVVFIFMATCLYKTATSDPGMVNKLKTLGSFGAGKSY